MLSKYFLSFTSENLICRNIMLKWNFSSQYINELIVLFFVIGNIKKKKNIEWTMNEKLPYCNSI